MRVRVRHAWLQKHPSPRHAGGDFHWYPGDGDAELRASLAEAARAGGQALWRIEPARVAWAVSFSEIAPADRRRYVGLAVAIAEPLDAVDAAASTAELLAAIAVPPAAPWREQPLERVVDVAPLADMSPSPDLPGPIDAAVAAGVASALACGGACPAPDATSPAWPARLASLETWLDPDVRARPRVGVLGADAPPPGPMHHYLGVAWALPPPIAARDPRYGQRAWRLAQALAARQGLAVDALFDDLAAMARAWNTAPELDAYLARTGAVRPDERAACDRRAPAPLADAPDAGRLWSRVVHYWGRGLLAGDGLDERLAALLARRVVADHLFHLDAPDQPALPRRYLRRLRWESLLPAPRMRALEARLAAHIPEVMGA